MADSIDELFDCFDEGGDGNNEEKNTDLQEDQHITNRYVTISLTLKTR